MNLSKKLFIKATASATGSLKRDNSYFESYLDTSDEWIQSRTGIASRFHIDENESTLSLTIDCATKLVSQPQVDKTKIKAVIVASSTPADSRNSIPSLASYVANHLGIDALAFDLSSACTSFSYSLITAYSLINSLPEIQGDILVIGSDAMTTVLDKNDRNTIILFGDASAGVLLSTDEEKTITTTQQPNIELLQTDMGSIPETLSILEIPANKTEIFMNGREVFKHAVRSVQHSIEVVLEKENIKGEDITCFIPHQANIRIIDSINNKVGIKKEATITNLHKYGNTSSASIPTAIHEAIQDNKILPGYLLITGFGAGMTVATSLWKVTND
jgi:3-oxoacyl-[acyl-carrier-protein] synthase-3